MPLNPYKGWEVLLCPECAYAIEKCKVTRYIIYCPYCERKGREVKLVDRFVVHYPVNKVVKPMVGRTRE